MNLANRISITRIILIPFFIAAIVYDRRGVALAIFAAAMLTDALDGFIARTLGQKTRLGMVLDPIADKLLLMSAYVCLTFAPVVPHALRCPPYVTIAVISRDVFIVVGSCVIYLLTGDLKVQPSVAGKITTFLQMITIVSVLVSYTRSNAVWNAAVVFTCLSGVDYLLKGSRQLNNVNHLPRRGVAP